jgi:hypothetical protein
MAKQNMKKLIQGGAIAAAAGILFLGLLGCGVKPMITGSGTFVTGTVDIDAVTDISASYTCVVTITQGASCSMEVKADDNILDYVIVEENGNNLDVSLNPFYNYNNITFIVNITVPDLEEVSLSGASTGYLDACSLSNDLTIDLSGASSLEAAAVECLVLTADLSGASSLTGAFETSNTFIDSSGASDVELRGSTVTLSAEGSGASSLYLSEYESVSTEVELSGASYGEIYCTGVLELWLSGASTLYYSGNPVLGTVDISGASSLIPLGVK